VKKFTTRSRVFKSSPAEFGMNGRSAENWVYLGRLAEAGPLTDVRFDTALAHVIGLFGKRGSGKSYTLGTLLEGLCTLEATTTISANPRTQAVLLFDTLGIFQWANIALNEQSQQETIIQQFAVRRGWSIKSEPLDVAIWIPKGSASDSTPSTHKEFTIRCSDFAAEDWGYLLGLNIYQDRMGQLLNDAFIKVTLEGWSDGNHAHKATSTYSLTALIKCIEADPDLKTTYATETRRALRQQLCTYERNPIFADDGTALQDMLQPGRMSVIVMNKMSDELRLIVVAAFLRRLIASRIRASETEKHLKLLDNLSATEQAKLKATVAEAVPPTWVAIDEAQNILPSERATSATDVIVKYVREGRNYGLSFVVATQQPTSIDPRILAQVDTLIAHKLTVQGDIDYVKRNMKSNMPDEVKYANVALDLDGILRGLDIGQALVSNTETDRAFLLDIRPRVSVHGGF
jgi:ABC-type dipeptide/oligopeptide/nickel transport system ATPase subunit